MALQTSFQRRLLILIAGFTQKCEHIFLVRLNTGLVEGINTEHIAGDRASDFKEVEEVAERVCAAIGNLENDVGNAAVGVCDRSALIRHRVDVLKGLAGQEVQTVDVCGVIGNRHLCAGVLHRDDGFELIAQTVLNILAERVKVGGENDRGGVNALLILALAFAEELLPPFVEHRHVGLVADENFGNLALAVEDVTHCGVLVAVVLADIGIGVIESCGVCACHQLLNVNACNGDGEKSYCGK